MANMFGKGGPAGGYFDALSSAFAGRGPWAGTGAAASTGSIAGAAPSKPSAPVAQPATLNPAEQEKRRAATAATSTIGGYGSGGGDYSRKTLG